MLIGPAEIAALLPPAGAMCLIEAVAFLHQHQRESGLSAGRQRIFWRQIR